MEWMSLTPWHLGLFVATGFLAGFIDSIAGGGGLVSLPVLMSLGLPPQLALGTNKLQGTFGTLTASVHYLRKGAVTLSEAAPAVVFTLLGSLVGAWMVQRMDATFVRHLIPFLLLAVLTYMVLQKDAGEMDRARRMPAVLFAVLFGTGLGFYDGFFGPGTGSFWTAALVVLLGYNMTRAAGFTRIVNFTSNVTALGAFVAGGNVIWSAGLCMALGQVTGARAGAGLAVRKGVKVIRPLFIAVVFVTIVRLIYKSHAAPF